MYHFIAFVCNSEDLAAREQVQELLQKLCRSPLPWECHLSSPGLAVFALPPSDPALRSYVLADDAGVVLGRLFKSDLSNPHLANEHVDERAVREIVETAGKQLVQQFWGGYVAFLQDKAGHRAWAIRDSSGKLPCYYTRFGEITILFADIGDLTPLELPTFTVNWQFLAAFIYSSQLQIRDCAFREIKELLAGECLQVTRNSVSQTALWDPRTICRERRIDSYLEGVADVGNVGQKCIDAWACSYDPILHALSGGFDSAAVLGCLSRSPSRRNITCLNLFTAASHEDERSYASLIAARVGVKLLELPMELAANRFDARLLSTPKAPKPEILGLFRLLQAEEINRISATIGAHTLWTGQGGDHIFLQTADPSSAGDYLATRGLRCGFMAAVRDAARLSRQPYWFVLRSACNPRRVRELPAQGLARQPYFVNPAALPDNTDQYVSNPWTFDSEDLPKGKRMQIRCLAEVTNRHRPIPRLERAPQHHPLLSQPLMEVCLQIPTYLLVRGGRERALAREAFSDRVPEEILRRCDKGSTVSHATEMIRQGEEFVRKFLLGGILAAKGIIIRSELEPYFIDGQPFREDHLLPLLACVAAEVWVRTNATSSETGG